MLRRTTAVAVTLALAALWAMAPDAQEAGYIRQHYAKFEHMVPMRDGVKLFTSVYVPKDKSRTYPIVLRRTPYGSAPYGLDAYIDRPDRQRLRYFQEGYIVVYQDVRGRFMSEGEFVNVRPYIPKKRPGDIDETTDTYDKVEWLLKNVPANNGRVGISGISYPGFYSTMGAIDAHPAVRVVSPQAPVSTWMGGDDFWHNGAFLLSHAFDFYIGFGQPRPAPTKAWGKRFEHGTPDAYAFFLDLGPLPNANTKYMKNQVAFWNEIMEQGQWTSFWAARDVLPHLKEIKPAMLVVGGWFDTENLYGALHTYQAAERQSPGATNLLVMGPWSHGQWGSNEGSRLGDIAWGSSTSDYYTEHVELPFFNHHLKAAPAPELREATVFETGANEWRSLDSWPPGGLSPREVFLHADGRLAFVPQTPGDGAFREYVSDPARPAPYTAATRHWYDPGFMVEDQRFASRRTDVLVYESDPLEEDLRVAGPITASLFVSTSGTDSDWVVKVIDVLPPDTPNPDPNPGNVQLGGYQMLVRGDVMRGKFRNDLARPEPFEPNEPTKVEFALQDVFHTFKKGHRLMVHVQSSWFPMIDRNPQKFVNIYSARAEDFQKATERVYSDAAHPSKLRFSTLPQKQGAASGGEVAK
jgi:putative CocE/NonD family hydrolase